MPGSKLNATAEALRPFAAIGQWLFARDLPDDMPMVQADGINGHKIILTRGHFKAAHLALAALEATNDERYCASCRHWSGRPVASVSWGAPMACNTSSRETCADWTKNEAATDV